MPKRMAPKPTGAGLSRRTGGAAHERRATAARADGYDAPGLAGGDLHVGEAREERTGAGRGYVAGRDRLGLVHCDAHALAAMEVDAAHGHRARLDDRELRVPRLGGAGKGAGDREKRGYAQARAAHQFKYLPVGLSRKTTPRMTPP